MKSGRLVASINLRSAGKLLLLVVIIWIVLILYLSGPLLRISSHDFGKINGETGESILARLSRATNELDNLRSQNQELKNLLLSYLPAEPIRTANSHVSPDQAYFAGDLWNKIKSHASVPDREYELSRRRLSVNLNELWFFLQSLHLNSSIYNFINQHRASYLYDLEILAKRDHEWRKNELSKLANQVQSVISRLQNPQDCENARKLVCRLNKGCGFGCQIHHLVYCFMIALASGRTLILDSRFWRYAPSSSIDSKQSGWNLVFQSLSNTCLSDSGSTRKQWSQDSQAQVVDLPIIDALRPRPPHLPLTIPEEISEKLTMLHGAPSAWFIGQIVSYIMRLSSGMQSFIDRSKAKFNFRTPILGIHVRRTDKVGTEASFHSLSEYMKHADNYFETLKIFRQRAGLNDQVEKVIYLATDDIEIWKSEIKPYEAQGYVFIGDSHIAKTAGLSRRYSINSLKNVILDILLLSECDFLVCTFSSQVCRLAYELMQNRGLSDHGQTRLDWSQAFISLDDIYYFGGQNDHNQIAILNNDHPTNGQIPFKRDDIIGIAGNHWNGYSKGVNRRLSLTGLYPGFKTKEKIDIAKFKAFQDL